MNSKAKAKALAQVEGGSESKSNESNEFGSFRCATLSRALLQEYEKKEKKEGLMRAANTKMRMRKGSRWYRAV